MAVKGLVRKTPGILFLLFCSYYGDKSMCATEQGILNEQMNAAIIA
jgi:hypothetical protein